jgi:hypothetical protein
MNPESMIRKSGRRFSERSCSIKIPEHDPEKLAHRAAMVEDLFTDPPGAKVLVAVMVARAIEEQAAASKKAS